MMGKFDLNHRKFLGALSLGLGSVDMLIVGFETEAQVDNYLERTSSALQEIIL